MIVIIAVLAITLLIACVGLHVLNEGVKESHDVAIDNQEKWIKEMQHRIKLEAELSERPLPTQPENTETGNFIKRQAMRRATPETYRNVFDLDVNGQRVIEHLQLTFANKSTYVRGGQDAERESCFKAGQATVIGFILNQINKANDPNYKEEVND